MRIVARVGDLVQRTGDGQAQVGYLVVGRSRGQMTLCAVCTMYKEASSACFLIWPQNHGRWFLLVWPQNRQLQFGDLSLKFTSTISLLAPQNQTGYDLSVAPQNRREDEDGMGHASRSSGVLGLEVSRARYSQSSLKTGGGVGQMVHVAPS
jgi:hypothetical protein